jgi:hypothetical protein
MLLIVSMATPYRYGGVYAIAKIDTNANSITAESATN